MLKSVKISTNNTIFSSLKYDVALRYHAWLLICMPSRNNICYIEIPALAQLERIGIFQYGICCNISKSFSRRLHVVALMSAFSCWYSRFAVLALCRYQGLFGDFQLNSAVNYLSAIAKSRRHENKSSFGYTSMCLFAMALFCHADC